MPSWNPISWRFDIDQYLNPFIPPPPWRHIPYPVAYILGHRRHKPRDIGTIVPVIWAFIGIFIGVSVIQLVSENIPSFASKGAPAIVASFGAGAVLEFYAVESPLAQPRNFLAGQLIAATLGMGICKLFQMSASFISIRWLAGAISCATVTAVMALTKTIHPPAGATALLAVVDDQVLNIGWFFIPVVLLNCAIMLIVAMLVNNVQRTFPAYWWTPEELRKIPTDPEKGDDDDSVKATVEEMRTDDEGPGRGSETSRHGKHEIIIRRGQLILPEHIFLMQEEIQLLEEIGNRI